MNIVHFIKFGLVGASGLVVDFSVTWLCKEKIKLNKYVANGVGFLFGVTNNYILNKYFTFQNTDTDIAGQFFKFLVVSVIGFALNTGMLYLLQKNTKINFYVSKALVTLVVLLWNFTANSLYTFNT